MSATRISPTVNGRFASASSFSPSIFAVPRSAHGNQGMSELLSAEEKAQLRSIARFERVARDTLFYEQGDRSLYFFNLVAGMAETYITQPDGTRQITAFLAPHDLFGLAEEGRYITTAKAVTDTAVFRIPIEALEHLMRRNPALQMHLITRLCHDIRTAQRHLVTLSRHDARDRVARFLLSLDVAETQNGTGELVELPMSRSDIADFLALSIEAVSRALTGLEDSGRIRRVRPRLIEIVDRSGLDEDAGLLCPAEC